MEKKRKKGLSSHGSKQKKKALIAYDEDDRCDGGLSEIGGGGDERGGVSEIRGDDGGVSRAEVGDDGGVSRAEVGDGGVSGAHVGDDGGERGDEVRDDRAVIVAESLSEDDCQAHDDVNGEDEVFETNKVVEEIDSMFREAEAEEFDGHGGSDADSGDDVWNDEKIPDPYSESDDEEEPRQIEDDHESDIKLALGRTFASADEFKDTLFRYSLKTRRNIEYYLSSSLKLGARCVEPKCQWRVYCAYERRKRKLMIKCLNDNHSCLKDTRSKLLKPTTIGKLFSERLRLDPKITNHFMAAEIKREFGLTVSPDQCAKAKTRVLNERRKTHEEHFAKIWDYQAEILEMNPGTKMDIETIPGPTIGSKQRFFRLYICFDAQREAWKKTCRPIIGLDGCFLKWDIKGQLLAAVGRDGDNRIVPIAWAIVEIENDVNWDWFVRRLSRDLGLNDGRDIAMLSDKQKGLVKAIKNILPLAEHRQCCRHIMDNWKKDNRDMVLQKLFWKIARAYTPGYFDFQMGELEKYNKGAYESLLLTNPRTWSRAYFRIGSLCNDNLNNLCEVFNKTIREARRKPLLDMLEEIRIACMQRNAKRAIIAKNLKSTFTKRAHAEIDRMTNASKYCQRYVAVDDLHEVDHGDDKYFVNMNERTCGCRKWQMTGIPCVHATCVIKSSTNLRIEDYVSPFYTTENWRETYSYGIKPIQGKQEWPHTGRLPVLPPPWRINRGRPNSYARRKSAYETVPSSNNTKLKRNLRVMTCSRCKQEGHNVVTCKNAAVENPPTRGRGRPRKNQGESSASTSQVQSSQVQESQFFASQGWEQNSQGHASQRTQDEGIQQAWARWLS